MSPSFLETQIENLRRSGYPEDEVEAFREGFVKARGRSPERYTAGWRKLDAHRARAGVGQPGAGAASADTVHPAD